MINNQHYLDWKQKEIDEAVEHVLLIEKKRGVGEIHTPFIMMDWVNQFAREDLAIAVIEKRPDLKIFKSTPYMAKHDACGRPMWAVAKNKKTLLDSLPTASIPEGLDWQERLIA